MYFQIGNGASQLPFLSRWGEGPPPVLNIPSFPAAFVSKRAGAEVVKRQKRNYNRYRGSGRSPRASSPSVPSLNFPGVLGPQLPKFPAPAPLQSDSMNISRLLRETPQLGGGGIRNLELKGLLRPSSLACHPERNPD